MDIRIFFAALLLGIFAVACAPPATNQPATVPAATAPAATVAPTTAPATAAPEQPTAEPTATSAPVQEGMADVEFVKAVQAKDGAWTFSVTVRHPDTGWEDYADGWDVVTPDGEVLKVNPDDPFTRLLLHPHVGEQPFTRSQSRIRIPDGVAQVTVRAHSLTRGFGGREVIVDLTKESGDGFEVQRAQSPATPQSKTSISPAAYTYPRGDGNHLAACVATPITANLSI